MAGSGEAFGDDHPCTRTEQPQPTHRRAELSEIAFGDPPPSFSVPIIPDSPDQHDRGPDA
ncbi:MAG: hypothetical protein JWO61_139 [Candidatus Saccharibacteria bacterium]|nr:hypothetical protein [Candidatus Saccharibacteria bacterium]